MALVAYRVVFSTLLFQYFVDAGIYLQSPRGSNNRINEPTADRRNDRRLFDSQVNLYNFHGRRIFLESFTYSQGIENT